MGMAEDKVAGAPLVQPQTNGAHAGNTYKKALNVVRKRKRPFKELETLKTPNYGMSLMFYKG